MKNQPIGFLDSGVGGLTVVKEVLKLLPNEQIMYIGDSARNPYGPRPMKEVQKFTHQLAHFLVEQNIKLLVVACNTATVAALKSLKDELPVPVIGVIAPGTYAAVLETKNNEIGVIGTVGTIASNEYEKQILNEKVDARVTSIATQEFVAIVEKNQFESQYAKGVVEQELEPFITTNIDTLVLGCTHYPLLQPIIQEFFGKEVTLIDPGVETARVVERYLSEHDLLNQSLGERSKHLFYTTGSAERFKEIATNWLEVKNFDVMNVSIEELEKYV